MFQWNRYGEISELTAGQCIPQHNLRKRLHRCLKVDITNSLVLQFEGSTPSTKNPVNGRHPVPVSSPPQKKKKKKVHAVTGHEGPEGEERYSCTL